MKLSQTRLPSLGLDCSLSVRGFFFVCLFCSLHNFHSLFLTHAANTLKISDVEFVFLMYAFIVIILLKHHKQISIFYRSKKWRLLQ